MNPLLVWAVCAFIFAVGQADGFWTSDNSLRTVSGPIVTAGRRGLLQVCGPTQFMKDFRAEEGGPCMDCDSNCSPGECVDSIGCNVCVDGFYRTRVDDLWPFDCANCRDQIPNCTKCKDGVFTDQPVQCEECDGNFVTNEANDACVCQESFQLDDATNTCVFVPSGLSDPGVPGVSITLDFPERSEVPLPQEGINLEQISVQSVPFDAPTCGEGEFLAESGDVCIVCDPKCEAGSCIDYDGCLKCQDGFFGSTFLGTGPLKCRACSAQNCITCVDDFLDASSVLCVECSPGFEEKDGTCHQNQSLESSPVLSQSQPNDGQSSDNSSNQQDSFETNIFDLGTDDASPGDLPLEGTGEECPEKTEADAALISDIGIEASLTPTADGEVITFLPPMEVDLSSEISGDVSSSTFPLELTVPEPAVPEPAIENDGDPAFDGIGVQGVEIALGEDSLPESPTDACDPGQFLKKMDNSCETCDPNCAGDACVDFDGCLQCNAGFFRARRDDFWPFKCYECNIENCEVCRDGNFDSSSPQCDKCVAGFVLTEAGNGCEPFGPVDEGLETVPDAQIVELPPSTVPINEQSIGDVCGENRFRKEFDLECMDCDANCSPGYCVDSTGCDRCLEGFYRTRPDHQWPFSCKNCKEKIPNCRLCRDGVFDAWPVLCAECESTFSLIDGGAACACEEGLRLNDRGDTCIPA